MAAEGPDRSTLIAFGTAVLIGGSNFVAVRYSNRELDPTWGAALRFSLGTLLFIAIGLVMRIPFPRGRAFVGAAIYGGLGFGFAYFFLYYALVGLQAGTGSMIVAAAPLATLILAVAHRQERFTTHGLIGGVLAIAGIAILSSGSLGGDLSPLYVGSAVLGVLSIGESTVVIKGFPRSHPVTTNAVGMATGALLLLIASVVLGDDWSIPSRSQTLIALTWLVVAGSVALFLLYLQVIARWSASATNYIITLMPVVAVTLGAVIADETIRVEVVAGGALVLCAVYVGALRQNRHPRQPQPPGPVVASPAPESR